MGCELGWADCLNQDLQDFANFGMGGAPLAQGRWYECLTRDHESLREIGGGGCLRVHGGQLTTAAVVGTGDNLTLEEQIGGHGGQLAVSAAAGAGGGGWRRVGRCAMGRGVLPRRGISKGILYSGIIFAIRHSFCASIVY